MLSAEVNKFIDARKGNKVSLGFISIESYQVKETKLERADFYPLYQVGQVLDKYFIYERFLRIDLYLYRPNMPCH